MCSKAQQTRAWLQHKALPPAPSSCQQLPGNQWADSGGKIPVHTWWGVRGARTGDGERSKGSWSAADKWIVPTHVFRFHQKFGADFKKWPVDRTMILMLFSLGGFPAVWGVLRLVQHRARDWDVILQRPWKGEMGREGKIPFWVFPCHAHICHGVSGCPGSTLQQQHPLPAFPGSSTWTMTHWQYHHRPWRSQLSLLL